MAKADEKKNVKLLSDIVYILFCMLKPGIWIKNINYPKNFPVIFGLWHAHQCALHGIEDKEHTAIMISKSVDGQIIANVVEKWGFKTVRGSKGKKGAIEATKTLISMLKSGESAAITVDGPSGPVHQVKDGIIMIAKNTGRPIIPMVWYSPSPTLITLPSWDKFRFPICHTSLVNVYGEPIYVNPDNTPEQDEEVKETLRSALFELEKKAPDIYREAWSLKWWKKKKN